MPPRGAVRPGLALPVRVCIVPVDADGGGDGVTQRAVLFRVKSTLEASARVEKLGVRKHGIG